MGQCAGVEPAAPAPAQVISETARRLAVAPRSRIARLLISPPRYFETLKVSVVAPDVSKPCVERAYSVCLPTAGVGIATLQVDPEIRAGTLDANDGSSSDTATDRFRLAEY